MDCSSPSRSPPVPLQLGPHSSFPISPQDIHNPRSLFSTWILTPIKSKSNPISYYFKLSHCTLWNPSSIISKILSNLKSCTFPSACSCWSHAPWVHSPHPCGKLKPQIYLTPLGLWVGKMFSLLLSATFWPSFLPYEHTHTVSFTHMHHPVPSVDPLYWSHSKVSDSFLSVFHSLPPDILVQHLMISVFT